LFSVNSVANFRDVAIGPKMKKNVLFRCAKLSTLNKEDIITFETLNPYAVVDFRDPKEINKAPDNLSKGLIDKYISLPISASTLGIMVAQKSVEGDTMKTYEKVMEESYKLYVNNHQHVWKEFLNILLNSNNKPVIFHCSAGKDRTGIASFIIQRILNNSMELIYKNYLLSNQLLTTRAATAEQTTSSSNDDLLVTETMLNVLSKVKKTYLLSAINEIENKYQTLENYIIEGLNFDKNKIDQLKRQYSI
jgi:protein-tyrosine phosphatase